MIRREPWGAIELEDAGDTFSARICDPSREINISRPLSISLSFRTDAPLDHRAWIGNLRRLSLWGLLRIHSSNAELLKREDAEWLIKAAKENGLTLVFSFGAVPPDLANRFPRGTRLHVPVEPAEEDYRERLGILHSCIHAGHRVRALTTFDPARFLALEEMGSDLIIHGIEEWALAVPPSTGERLFLPLEETPQIVRDLREDHPSLKVEVSMVWTRENNLILQDDGALFTADLFTSEDRWLGWLKDGEQGALSSHRDFSYERHFDLWVQQKSDCSDPDCLECGAHKDGDQDTISGLPRKELLLEDSEEPTYHVFIAYAREDSQEVIPIAQKLEDHGILVWLDQWRIRPGQTWPEEVAKQINRISVMALFLGTANPESGFWDFEKNAFLAKPKNKRILIPVLLPSYRGSEGLKDFLGALHYVDFRQSEPDPFELLVWGITGQKPRT